MEKTRREIISELEDTDTIAKLDGICGMLGVLWENMDAQGKDYYVKAIGSLYKFMDEQMITLHRVLLDEEIEHV